MNKQEGGAKPILPRGRLLFFPDATLSRGIMHAMSAPDPVQNQANAPPDWATLTIDLHCPRCGYNLRMLTGSRCPECGLDLEWERIVASAQSRIDSPLFEYRWRIEPVGSFIRTIQFAMRPWRLWKRISLADDPDVGGLTRFTVFAFALYALAYSVIAYLGGLVISVGMLAPPILPPPSAWWLPIVQTIFDGVLAAFVQFLFAVSLIAFLAIFH